MIRKTVYAIISFVAVMALVDGPVLAAEPLKKGPVKVFILAGQSNMEGHASEGTLDHLGDDPTYGSLLGKIKKKDGTLIVRDDVWIEYLGKKGNLQMGFGVGGTPGKFGPELAFGINVGDYFENQVLLIKTCWGGHSLYGNFRPPSSGPPFGEPSWGFGVGGSYTNMVALTRKVVKNLKMLFPEYDESKGYEIAGFLWFQGFNDQFDPKAIAEYEQNMVNLINDLRKEFNVPNMPVVIGELGTGGSRGPIALAQEAAAKHPEFKGTVRSVETAKYWDFAAQKLQQASMKKPKAVIAGPVLGEAPDSAERVIDAVIDSAKEKAKPKPAKVEEPWRRMISSAPYHYLGSGKMMFLMGNAMGEAMVELLKQQK